MSNMTSDQILKWLSGLLSLAVVGIATSHIALLIQVGRMDEKIEGSRNTIPRAEQEQRELVIVGHIGQQKLRIDALEEAIRRLERGQ